MKFSRLILAAGFLIIPSVLLAQTPSPTPPPAASAATAPTLPPSKATARTIHKRKVDQQQRIAEGVEHSQLTAGETSRLEHQEAGINREESGMRAQDNGHLTSTDKKILDKQQNQESRRIARAKHNSRKR